MANDHVAKAALTDGAEPIARDHRGFPTDGSYVDLTDPGPEGAHDLKVWRAKRFVAGLKTTMADVMGPEATLKQAHLFDAGMVMVYDRGNGSMGQNQYIDPERVRGETPEGGIDAGPLHHLIEVQDNGYALVYPGGDKEQRPRAYEDVFKALERTLIQQEGQPLAKLTDQLVVNMANIHFQHSLPKGTTALPQPFKH